MNSWYELLRLAMEENGEDFEKRICTMTDEQLKVNFDDDSGEPEGLPFTAWGPDWVYFPIIYDGKEWVGSAPRNPCDHPMAHQGGW